MIGNDTVRANITSDQSIVCIVPQQTYYGNVTVEISLDGVQFTNNNLSITFKGENSWKFHY